MGVASGSGRTVVAECMFVLARALTATALSEVHRSSLSGGAVGQARESSHTRWRGNLMTVHMEHMRPEELDKRRDAFPVAYVPLGALEFHGYHLPVGLDAVKCHRMLIRMAERLGGIVVPPLYLGHGSGHTGFPWTFMLPTPDALTQGLLTLMQGLEQNGIRVIVLMSGHYPNESVFDDTITAFKQQGGTAAVVPLMEYHAFDEKGEWHGDHAAKWETSYMLALGDNLVDLSRLRENPDGTTLDQVPAPQPPEPGGWWFEKNESHPWYGVAGHEGNDPLEASVALGDAAIDTIIEWAKGKIDAALEKGGRQV
ncbi:MAG: hypothetical protein GF331_20390 [Chitinivibrionales bacterium]|nr:hypothetical protein [Chitinivibrionales bacterium]